MAPNLPTLPKVVRFRVWDFVALHLFTSEDREFDKLNRKNNSLSLVTTSVLIDRVSATGQSHLFASNIAKTNKELLSELLGSLQSRLLFVCDSSTALYEFGQRVKRYWRSNPGLIPRVRVELNIFKDFNEAQVDQLCSWAMLGEYNMAHGSDVQAEAHFRGWMDAVRAFPVRVDTDVVMHCPWRDYRMLRVMTSLLRDVEQRNIRVRANRDAWRYIHDPEFHIGLTIASIEGGEMARQSNITFDEARELVEYGCRGFRGQPSPSG